MKLSSVLSCAVFVLIAAISASADVAAHVRSIDPPRISYDSLAHPQDDEATLHILLDALTETGMISITEIPSFPSQDMLASLHQCALVSQATHKQHFADGARRLTMATHWVPGPGGMQTMDHYSKNNNKKETNVCQAFDQLSTIFRHQVAATTQLFAEQLTRALEPHVERPLLVTAQGYPFDTLADAVRSGEHLEHFRSYQKNQQQQQKESVNYGTNDTMGRDTTTTIQLHTDQGVFLVFTPAQIQSQSSPTSSTDSSIMAHDFFIQTNDGSLVRVEFTKQDSLVILLGDGVHQMVNHKLRQLSKPLRAVPHSVQLAATAKTTAGEEEDSARVWYGRMVLPPSSAVHPQHQMTFGDLRKQLIQASSSSLSHNHNDVHTMSLGCSGRRLARELSGGEEDEEEEPSPISCSNETSIYCWHQCMEYAEFNVSLQQCADQELEMTCINPRLQKWKGESHGDYYPACLAADAELETPIPTLPEYPRSESNCTYEGFMEFASANTDSYTTTLTEEETAMLFFAVKDDMVHARIVFNGLFGWLAFGLANPTGDKNGMHGARVIMAQPGGNYTGFSGLDLSMNDTVASYQIDLEMTPFRYWMDTMKDGDAVNYTIESTECYTALTFEATGIQGQQFNLTGTDNLLWAANGEDYYVMYHGSNRGRFSIDWSTGSIEIPVEEVDAPTTAPSSAANSAKSIGFWSVLFLASLSFYTLN